MSAGPIPSPGSARAPGPCWPPHPTSTSPGVPEGRPDIRFDKVLDKKKVHKPDNTEAFYWETAIPQEEGRSGGPMIDARGYVIGIASGTQHKKGYYSHIDEIHSALKQEGFDWLYKPPPPAK